MLIETALTAKALDYGAEHGALPDPDNVAPVSGAVARKAEKGG